MTMTDTQHATRNTPPITRRQVLHFIVNYKATHDGLSPSYKEIGDALGLGTTTVKYHVDELVRLGYLVRRGRARPGLIVPGGKWTPPAYWSTEQK